MQAVGQVHVVDGNTFGQRKIHRSEIPKTANAAFVQPVGCFLSGGSGQREHSDIRRFSFQRAFQLLERLKPVEEAQTACSAASWVLSFYG